LGWPLSTDAARISIIPQASAFCQVKPAKKLHKYFSQNLCSLPIVFLGQMWYYNNVKREEKRLPRENKKNKKKKLLTS
jgi:hypothetical protein